MNSLFINPTTKKLFCLYKQRLFISAFYEINQKCIQLFDTKLTDEDSEEIDNLINLFDCEELFDCYLFDKETTKNDQSTLQGIFDLFFYNSERLGKIGLNNLQIFFQNEINTMLEEKAFSYKGKSGNANDWICNQPISFDSHELLQAFETNQPLKELI